MTWQTVGRRQRLSAPVQCRTDRRIGEFRQLQQRLVHIRLAIEIPPGNAQQFAVPQTAQLCFARRLRELGPDAVAEQALKFFTLQGLIEPSGPDQLAQEFRVALEDIREVAAAGKHPRQLIGNLRMLLEHRIQRLGSNVLSQPVVDAGAQQLGQVFSVQIGGRAAHGEYPAGRTASH